MYALFGEMIPAIVILNIEATEKKNISTSVFGMTLWKVKRQDVDKKEMKY